MKNSYLFLGPRENKQNPEVTGGVIVLFEDLLFYCRKHNIKYIVIDTNKANYKNKIFAYVQIIFNIIIKIRQVRNISIHGTANDYLYIAPFALLMAKIFNKHLSLRKFAGNFIEIYENYSTLKKIIIKKTLQNSSCNFFETKYLVKYFEKYNNNTFWFPNVRNKPLVQVDEFFKKRFVYLGAIKKEKGINTICKVSNILPPDYQIDLYGTLYDDFTETFFDNYNVTYNGPVLPENVINVLSQYDVLLLPTFWHGEGYPGVIIEALSVGLPIIATNLDGIKEMINERSSVLIEPLNELQLKDAIESFNTSNYKKKSISAIEQFDSFNSEIQTKHFFNKINLYEIAK